VRGATGALGAGCLVVLLTAGLGAGAVTPFVEDAGGWTTAGAAAASEGEAGAATGAGMAIVVGSDVLAPVVAAGGTVDAAATGVVTGSADGAVGAAATGVASGVAAIGVAATGAATTAAGVCANVCGAATARRASSSTAKLMLEIMFEVRSGAGTEIESACSQRLDRVRCRWLRVGSLRAACMVDVGRL